MLALMRMTIVGLLGFSLCACAPTAVWPPMPYADQASLPYSACGDMRALRANLTGAPEPMPASDAILARLGVRCVASYPPPPVRARD
jgi:hypothetical protein